MNLIFATLCTFPFLSMQISTESVQYLLSYQDISKTTQSAAVPALEKNRISHIALKLCDTEITLRYPSLRFMPPPWYNVGEWNFFFFLWCCQH